MLDLLHDNVGAISAVEFMVILYAFRDRVFGRRNLGRDLGRVEGKVDALIPMLSSTEKRGQSS